MCKGQKNIILGVKFFPFIPNRLNPLSSFFGFEDLKEVSSTLITMADPIKSGSSFNTLILEILQPLEGVSRLGHKLLFSRNIDQVTL